MWVKLVSALVLAVLTADDVTLPEGVMEKLADVKEAIAAGNQDLTAQAIDDITKLFIDVFRPRIFPR